MALVLVVDDDPIVRDLVRAVLLREGAQVVEAASVSSGKAGLNHGVDLLISDLGLPDGEGTELLEHADSLDIPHICMSARTGPPPLRATRFLRKPVPLSKLAEMVRPLLVASEREPPVRPAGEGSRIAALASATEALARCEYGTLPLRQVLIRFMNDPSLAFVAIYEKTSSVPAVLDWAGRGQNPRDVDAFFGRADLLSGVLDDGAVALEIPGNIAPGAGCAHLLLLPLIYGGEVVGAMAFGGTSPPDRAFCKAMLGQMVPMVMLLRLHDWLRRSNAMALSVP
jgi:two-component system, chemotaxis family, chemotaxis protein CheY